MEEIAWISIDPVSPKVDFYPHNIAKKIEKTFSERNVGNNQYFCELGPDFYSATVHFHSSGLFYQTTPGLSLGRNGFKNPGYRSVKRIIVSPERVITVYAKKVYGEWRITDDETESEITFTETISPDNIISSEDIVFQVPQVWESSYLLTEDKNNLNVISWQWCMGLPEKQGDLLKLSDRWWSPYPEIQNQQIEDGFQKSMDTPSIQIGDRRIHYLQNTCYAKQYDETGTKERMVRRITTTVSHVKEMLKNMSNPPRDMTDILSELPPDSIPNHFFCVITQNVMNEPVTTCDNFTYEKEAIERWFTEHSTSPMTGLRLESLTLVPNTTIYQQIQDFMKDL